MLSIRFVSAAMFLALVGCSHESQNDAQVYSHTTQNWTVSSVSNPLSMVAESGECLTQLPRSSFAAGYCFNKTPAARIFADVSVPGSMPGFCLATHLPGMAQQAALIVVDAQGNLVSEVTSSGSMQMIDSLVRSGNYTFYVGFPTNAAGQRATLRVAPLAQFAVSSPACNFK